MGNKKLRQQKKRQWVWSVFAVGIGSIPYILIEFFQLCTWFASVCVFLSFSLTYFSNYGICTGISVLTWELSESLKPNPRNCRGWSFNKPSADSDASWSLIHYCMHLLAWTPYMRDLFSVAFLLLLSFFM